MKRKKLPTERKGLTHRFAIRSKEGTVKGFITTGHYEDGTLGEIFVKLDQQGSQISGFIDAGAISVSLLLQGGMALEALCKKFKGSRFEPAGMTDNEHIRFAQSPIDYIARWLEGKYVDVEMFEDAESVG